MPDPYLATFHADPNNLVFNAPSQSTAKLPPDILHDSAKVHELLKQGASAEAIAAEATAKANLSVQDAVAALVRKSSNLHALTRKLHKLAISTPDEHATKAIDYFGGKTEAGARGFAFRTDAKTFATPPHDIVYESSALDARGVVVVEEGVNCARQHVLTKNFL